MVGMLQANEAIKLITGLGETLASGLLIVDALLANMRRFDELPVDRDLILNCKSGTRSARGALYLASQRGFGWIYSLKSGITAPVQTLLEKYYANGGH